MTTRRKFIKNTAISGVGLTMVPHVSFGAGLGSNKEKLNVGLIGVLFISSDHPN